MLKMRILTALVLIAAVLAGIFYIPAPIQAGILLVICILAGQEWLRIINATTLQKVLFYNALIICAAVFYVMPAFAYYVLWISLLGWVFAFFTIIAYQRGKPRWPQSAGWNTWVGLWLLIPFWAGCFLLLQTIGPLALVYILLIVGFADSFAYLFGRLWGRHVLISRVSPGKTWEGVFSGFVVSALVAFISVHLFFLQHPHSVALFTLGLCMIPVSIIGDLFESMVKRIYNVKDSGQLLPGHGGVLDRIDSLTAAVPIFTLGYFLLAI